MALPDGVTSGSLQIGRPFTAGGEWGTVKVKLTPIFGGTATHLVWDETGDSFEAFEENYGAGDDGDPTITITAPHVDQAGFSSPNGEPIEGWTYQVDVTPTGPNRQKGKKRTKFWSPVEGQGTADFEKLSGSSEVGAPTIGEVPALAAIAGLTGTPTATQLVNALLDALSVHFVRIIDHGDDPDAERVGGKVAIWAGTVDPENIDADYDLAVGPEGA